MKKIILLTAIALTSFAAATNAQEKGGFKLGVGPVASLPLGDLGDFTSFGIGGEAQASYGITDNIAGFVQAGYSAFLGKDSGPTWGVMQGLVGARYHMGNGFMAGAGVGYGRLSVKDGGSSGSFAFSPQVGYSFANGRLDVLAHYTGITTSGSMTSFAGLKVFFNFLSK